MENRLAIELTAVIVLVLINGFFALAEFSVIASRKSRLQQTIKRKLFGAEAAARLRHKPEKFLASVQVGITLTAALMGVFSGATLVNNLNDWLLGIPVPFVQEQSTTIAMTLVVLALTVLLVVIGELVPKFIALSHPERYARFVAIPVTLFIRVTSIFSRILSALAAGVLRLIGIRHSDADDAVTEEEINLMIREGKQSGHFDETEYRFIRSLFQFTDATVRRAMKPRIDVVAFDRATTFDSIVSSVSEHGFSRYPVFEENIDHIVGVLYIKDLIRHGMNPDTCSLNKLMREPLFVPDSMPLPKLLKQFRTGKNHMAIVLDKFGGTAGIITLEDILEELVGEIQDEYDTEAPPVVRISDQTVYADATVRPGEINQLLDSSLPENGSDTLAGLFMNTVGHVPESNESIQVEDVLMTVLARRGNRILRLKLERVRPLADNLS